MVSNSTPKHKSTRWIFDTGTSSQMTPNKDLFIPNSFKPCSGTTKSAHGGIGRISGVGDIRLKCRRRSGGMGYATLRDVVLDEGLEENLFSYLSVIGKGFKLQGEGDDVWLEDKKADEVLWAKREGKDIIIQELPEATRFVSYQECHNALGHPSVQVLSQAMNDLYLDSFLIPKSPKKLSLLRMLA